MGRNFFGEMMPELDFESHNTLYATHGLHAFPAKSPPQLVRYGLRYYSQPGDLLLDPMAGSGTALVEACLMGRNALGYEIDPLSRLIAKAKSKILEDSDVEEAQKLVLRCAARDHAMLQSNRISASLNARARLPDFHNRDYWFDSDVSRDLSILAYHIEAVDMSADVRDFLWVAFSSLILAKTSVANARDIIHSRHHYWKNPHRPDVLIHFDARVRRMRKQMDEFRQRCVVAGGVCSANAYLGDARRLDLLDETVDLVFTSPPYVTALDYPRAHFLAIPWMSKTLGIELEEYREKAQTYVGSERGKISGPLRLDNQLLHLKKTSAIIEQLGEISERQAKLCHRYFLDMKSVLSEISRVLKSNKHAIIVICPSHIRRVNVPTHEIFAEIGYQVGLKLKHQHVRTISERRRVMPYMSVFGSRMSTEYVLVFQKK